MITAIKLVLVFIISFASLLIDPALVFGEVNIVATVPNLGYIAEEVGGERVNVITLSKGYQDPHTVDPKPSFVLAMSRADMLVYNGLELEAGWLPVLISSSRNSKISAVSSPGNFDASSAIDAILDVPTSRIDRSMGDVHQMGNPHYLLDPRNGIAVARALSARLSAIDPEGESYYIRRAEDFEKRLAERIAAWEDTLLKVKGAEVITYHKSWTYFTNWAGLKEAGTLEPKPGIPPSPSHIASLIEFMRKRSIKIIIAEPYYPKKTARQVAERTGATLLILPSSVGGRDDVMTYFDLFDAIVNEVVRVLSVDGAS
ncbi:MAG: metal ABC transporter substrate-binding protein [Candidatus Caldarchaeum sp.]